MAEVDMQKISIHAHEAGLRRLSARANSTGCITPRKVFFSLSDYGRSAILHMKKCNISLAKGLSCEEFERIEATFGFNFPPDLRGILQEGLPVGEGFPDWRSSGLQQLKMWFNIPLVRLCLEVEKGSFWWKQWGPRPSNPDQAVQIARTNLKKAPILVPIYRNCYIPTSPNRVGNPVFHIQENEVAYVAYDVNDFIMKQSFGSGDWDLTPSFGLRDGTELELNGRGMIQKSASFELGSKNFCSEEEIGSDGSVKRSKSMPNKVEDSCEDQESWGRRLDALASNPDAYFANSERPIRKRIYASGQLRSSEASFSSSDEDACSDFWSQSSKKMLSRSSSKCSKTPRRIEFWSDMAEKEHILNVAPIESGLAEKELETGDRIEEKNDSAKIFVEGFVQRMSEKLKEGGWEEGEILEMAEAGLDGLEDGLVPADLDRQAVLQNLAQELDCLSDSLRQAGWSVQDVAEALSFDIPHSKPRLHISPQLKARICPLAAYVAQS